MKILSFDKKTANTFATEAITLLAPLAEKYGVEIRPAGGTFLGDEFTMKLLAKITGEEAEKKAFAQSCSLFNCKPEDYGRLATINRREVKLIGFELKRTKFCVRCLVLSEGKTMLYTEEVLWKYFHTGLNPAAQVTTATPFAPRPSVSAVDAQKKAQGFTHRVDGWIHPEAGGSDYHPFTEYVIGEPTKKAIEVMLAGSCEKNDYRVTAL